MGLPLPTPNVGDKKSEFVSKCEMYDGDAGTAGLCKGWVSVNSKCMRRDDEMGKACDGSGKF